VNGSTNMNDEDDDRLLNQALDDVELLFCAGDDDQLVRMVDELDTDQQQQQTTTTAPGQPHFSNFLYLSNCMKVCIQSSPSCLLLQLGIIHRKKPYLLASISVILVITSHLV